MVYEVKSPPEVQENYNKLTSDEGDYFYWNKKKFGKIEIGDPVFVVNPTKNEVLFTRREGAFIEVDYNPDDNATTIPDRDQIYIIKGKWDDFVRLRILSKRELAGGAGWNNLGNSETTYLLGPNSNSEVAPNNLRRVRFLRKLFADDLAAAELLDDCIKELQQAVGMGASISTEPASTEKVDPDELFAVLQRYEAETILFQSSDKGALYSVEADGPKFIVNRLNAIDPVTVSPQTYINHIRRLRERRGRMGFSDFDNTKAISNCLLQSRILALSADRKEIVDVSDGGNRIDLLCEIFKNLNVDRSREEPKLYKPAMLFCVIDAIEHGELLENRIPFDWIAPRFIKKLAELGEQVGNEQAAQAFCHLKSDMIWLHAVADPHNPMKDGREGPAAAREKVKYALIKETFWECLQDSANRDRALATLQEHWFGAASLPQFWWVNQGGIYKREVEGEYLWAPKKDKAGNSRFYWDNVRLARKGDIVFNYADGEIRAISHVVGEAVDSDSAEESDPWQKSGSRVELECHILKNPIQLSAIGKPLAEMSEGKYQVINKNYEPNQGYLFRLSEEAVRTIISHLKEEDMPEKLLSILPDPQDLTLPSTLDDSFIPAVTSAIKGSGFIFEEKFLQRFLFSLLAKPFVILTGTSGTGKTQLAMKFAQWLVGKDGYELVPVGADWTDNRQVLGQYNPFDKAFVSTRILDILLRAESDPMRPYFLILDEMNLSHVERYFADFLSGIESGDSISLHRNGTDVKTTERVAVPEQIKIPNNLFIVGTVNIDETTYMFSPKVLDRANVLEFSIKTDGFKQFFDNGAGMLEIPFGGGRSYALAFLEHATKIRFGDLGRSEIQADQATIQEILLDLFSLLENTGMEFAFRTASEIDRYCRAAHSLTRLDSWDLATVLDAQILQKILPKLHGSRRRIEPLLAGLCEYCKNADREAAGKLLSKFSEGIQPIAKDGDAKFLMSYRKLVRMIHAVQRDQFVSFIQ